MPRKRQKPVRPERCDTCVTKTRAEGGIELRTGALEEIQAAAITGVCQECHGDDNRTLCRGIRAPSAKYGLTYSSSKSSSSSHASK
jgi:hypothetical protein